MLFGILLLFVSGIAKSMEPQTTGVIVVFAGVGSIASILTRLNNIDLKEETSRFLVLMSGGSKPLVATVFAVIVFFIFNNKIVGMSFGSQTTDPNSFYVVTSFLCGFSERFAS